MGQSRILALIIALMWLPASPSLQSMAQSLLKAAALAAALYFSNLSLVPAQQ
jgi:hypothetical protein